MKRILEIIVMNKEKEEILRSFGRSEWMKLMDAEIHFMAERRFELKVPQKEFMVRPAGMFNGSTIAGIVDVSAGYAGVSASKLGAYFTTVELKVNYLNPAIGEYLIAKAEVIKNGKRIVVAKSDVYAYQNGVENYVATSLVTLMKIIPKS